MHGLLFAALIFSFIFPSPAVAIAALPVSSLNYQFSVDGTLVEEGAMNESSSPYWWVSSGAYLTLQDGTGRTVHGSLPPSNPWRLLYSANNPLDTDNGYHPQNIFRLVSRSKWSNVRVESSFKIDGDHFSASSNRNQSNGLLHMLRYKDQHTLYYTGIRVDGTAVIKKKKNGVYTTLAQKHIFPGTYSIAGNVNLLPHGAWVHLRSEVLTNTNGSVTIRLYIKKPGESGFTKIFDIIDSSSPITGEGYVGLRTDFMDVEFDNFKAEKI